METLNETRKDGYSSRFGLLCLMVGGSVGTGNLWRYPRLVCEYGGAFVVATVIALILIAIPLVMVENFAGRASRHSAPGAFRDVLGPKYTWMGTFATFCYFMMHANYTVILAWCVRYAFMSAGGTYFGVEDKLELFDSVAASDWITAVCWAIPMILVYFCVRKQSALEKVSQYMVPALAVILVVLVGYALTRDGASSGLEYSFSLEAGELFSANLWLEAVTQVFWSLGPGCMLAISISKFTAKDEDVVTNCKVQGFGDMAFAMMGTLVVLPCIFSFVGADAAVDLCRQGNNGLTFVGLTSLFESIPGGRILGALFFIALSFAAFTSIIAVTANFAGVFTDAGMSRKKAVILAVGGQMLFGLPSLLSQDFLTNQDTVWGFGIFIGGMFTSFMAFKFGAKKIRGFINPVSNKKVSRAFDICAGYIAPVATTVILAVYIVQAIGWDEEWWNPFAISSLGTMLAQWAVGFVVAFGTWKLLNRKIKHKYFDGKEFPEIPEELLEEV